MGTATMMGAVPKVIGSFGNQIFTAMVLFSPIPCNADH